MEVKITKAKSQKDVQSFYGLFAGTLRENFPHYSLETIDYFLKKNYTKALFLEEFKKREREIYLAKIDGVLAGYLTAFPPYGGVGYCNWVAVDSHYRGMGIASGLLSFWEKDVLKQGGHKVQLLTHEGNVDFYKRRGYKLFGSVKDDYFGLEDFYFYKTLKKSSFFKKRKKIK